MTASAPAPVRCATITSPTSGTASLAVASVPR